MLNLSKFARHPIICEFLKRAECWLVISFPSMRDQQNLSWERHKGLGCEMDQKHAEGHGCQTDETTDKTYVRKLECIRRLYNTSSRLKGTCNLTIWFILKHALLNYNPWEVWKYERSIRGKNFECSPDLPCTS